MTDPEPFAFLTTGMRRAFGARLRMVKAVKGRLLLAAGADSSDVFCLLEGRAHIALHSPQGREVPVRELEPGDVFGELAALDGGPRSASVVAITGVRLAVMQRKDFLACLQASPEASLWLARRLGAEVRRLTERVFELSALSMRARLHAELLRLARVAAPAVIVSPAPTHEDLARRIGATREAVTRELRELTRAGVIASAKRRIEFLDFARLEESAVAASGL
ncbi:MAG: Crp/Fnr family transcriptional regulator [Micropepsaceae bacterium]